MSKGGYISGAGNMPVATVKRLPDCPNGHPLYSVNSGPPEHVVSADEVRRNDHTQFNCQRWMEQS